MSYEQGKMFVYAIAGGETLAFIEDLRARRAEGERGLQKLAQGWGATLDLSGYGPRFVFDTQKNPLPAGWTEREMRGGSVFEADETTEDGQKIRAAISAETGKLGLQRIFNEACAHAANASRGSHDYVFEDVGGVTIVRSPKTPIDNTHFVPPGCTPITYGAYVQMKEQADTSAAPVLKQMPKPLKL